MTFAQRIKAQHEAAHALALSFYLRKSHIPHELHEILQATSSVKAFLDRGWKFDPDQPRVPAGQTGAGQWTSGGDGGDTSSPSNNNTEQPQPVGIGGSKPEPSLMQPPAEHVFSPNLPGWHSYISGPHLICTAAQNCSSQEIADQLSRYAVPGQSPSAPVIDTQSSWAIDPRTDLPAGEVKTYVSNDGLTVINKTMPDHIFYDGVVVRGAYQASDGGWYVVTHGYGNNVIPGMAELNEWQGPKIFDDLDRNLRENIASHH